MRRSFFLSFFFLFAIGSGAFCSRNGPTRQKERREPQRRRARVPCLHSSSITPKDSKDDAD